MTPIRTKAGDTLIEVMIAIAIYSVVALFTITTMRLGIQEGETALELAQARTAVNAQANAIRFIHNSFLAEREYPVEPEDSYKSLWQTIIASALDSGTAIDELAADTCPDNPSHGFIINTRHIDHKNPNSTVIKGTGKIIAPVLYPRLIYTHTRTDPDIDINSEDIIDPYIGANDTSETLDHAEGIWVVVRKSSSTVNYGAGSTITYSTNQYYDFHIYTCWLAPGANHPTTTGTIIRLYNPALKESIRS